VRRSHRAGTADLTGQPDGAPGLVLDPPHRRLVGPQIRPRDVIDEMPIAAAKARISRSLSRGGILGSAKINQFAAAVRQSGRGVLEGHRPRQAEGFFGADIRRHAHAADRWPAGNVVDRDDCLEADRSRWIWTSLKGPSSSPKRNASSITFSPSSSSRSQQPEGDERKAAPDQPPAHDPPPEFPGSKRPQTSLLDGKLGRKIVSRPSSLHKNPF
jgi:hypothetical protein